MLVRQRGNHWAVKMGKKDGTVGLIVFCFLLSSSRRNYRQTNLMFRNSWRNAINFKFKDKLDDIMRIGLSHYCALFCYQAIAQFSRHSCLEIPTNINLKSWNPTPLKFHRFPLPIPARWPSPRARTSPVTARRTRPSPSSLTVRVKAHSPRTDTPRHLAAGAAVTQANSGRTCSVR